MGLTTLENVKNYSRNRRILTDRVKLKKLVKEMQETLLIGKRIGYNSVHRFSWANKGKFNPFGYDIKKGEQEKSDQPIYRRNRLRYKLIRIQKEFKFVKSNIKNYLRLTTREKEIIQLLAQGYNNPKIAKYLSISRCTVEQHRKHINNKLKIKSFPHLMRYAYAFDLV